jgi:hypothetical protein
VRDGLLRMSTASERTSAWIRRRSQRRQPLGIFIALVGAAVFLALALPPIVRFAAFLFAGDVWRDLLGVALVSLLAGLALAAVIAAFDRPPRPGESGAKREDRSRGPLWALAGILIGLVPIGCILVALIASGTLSDVVGWVSDRVAEIRGAQSS